MCRQIHDEKGSGGKKRLMFRTKIKQEKMEEYIRHHQGVWPEVERGLRQWGVKLLTVLAVSLGLSLCLSSLFRTLEYHIMRNCSQHRLCVCACMYALVHTHAYFGVHVCSCLRVCTHSSVQVCAIAWLFRFVTLLVLGQMMYFSAFVSFTSYFLECD